MKEKRPVKNKTFETLPQTENTPEQTSETGTGAVHHPITRKRIGTIYSCALLLSLVLFYFHVVVIFDVITDILHYKEWMIKHWGPKHTGKILLLGTFFALMVAHIVQAAAWGFFLHWAKILSSRTEGVYFSAASITTLGYGDILLKYPWRHLGTLIAITGVLMFGCSTAFLFVILQAVWQHY